jgi:MEMO1 family protein
MKLNVFFKFRIIILFLVPTVCNSQVKKANTGDRQPVAAGSFYTANPTELKSQLNDFFSSSKKTVDKEIAGIIVPHAGYVFSGQVAASAYAQIDPDKTYSQIFILGTCHHALLEGASVYNRGNYVTPLGTVEVDTATANELIRKSRLFVYSPEADTPEHSIEVQLPFLQFRLKNKFKIVPIVVGTQSAETCKKLAAVLKPYFNEKTLFIVSSDFSHYPSYSNAEIVDKTTGDAIMANSPANFIMALAKNESKNIPNLATSCCGWSPVLTFLDISSENPGIKVRHLKYSNSGDTPYGDKSQVVGYHSFVFTREAEKNPDTGFSLTPEEKGKLIGLARKAILSYLDEKKIIEVSPAKYPGNLQIPCGAFVTLNKNGELRGCIGRFLATEPLYEVVQQMAIAAAFEDSRFNPVRKEEMKNIDIEISVLTPLKKIKSIDEFELGKQGIYMAKGSRSGTFLPQVEEQTGWTKEEFLGHCSQDKAGIGWNGWKDADLYTYEALVFGEKENPSPEK